MATNTHAHFFNYQVIPHHIYFGRQNISKKKIQIIVDIVEKVLSISDKTILFQAAEKLLLPLLGLDDEWKQIRTILKLYLMDMDTLVSKYVTQVMPNIGVQRAFVLIPNFRDAYTNKTVDIITASVQPYKKRLKVFAPHVFAKRDDVDGIKYYPALEGPPTKLDWKFAADLGKPIISHSSPGGVRDERFPEELAKKYNKPAYWMDALEKYPIKLCLAHSGGRKAFVHWFTEGYKKPGENWPYNNMVNTYDGVEYPGTVFVDCAFHENMNEPDYKLAVYNLTGRWSHAILTGFDDPLHYIQYSIEDAAKWTFSLFHDNSEDFLP